MSRRNLTEKQRRQRQEFVSGTTGLTSKQPTEHITEFQQLLQRLGLIEDACHLNEECAAWCRVNRDRRYIPENVLYRLRVKSLYEEEQAPFSLIDNTLVPEPKPLEETEVPDEPSQEQAA
jgi:hypothetical protein